jgi:drug/metabolite transporter (DMT)-like permease
MFSVLWARLFLRERLVPKQYVSILVAVAGIVLLGMEGA